MPTAISRGAERCAVHRTTPIWVTLAVAARTPGLAASILVVTFGVFGIGETMYGPGLNPMVAQLAPAGYAGTTLGLFSGLQTGVSALGPLVAGLVLGAGLADMFVGLRVAVSAVAVLAAWTLSPFTASAGSVPGEGLVPTPTLARPES